APAAGGGAKRGEAAPKRMPRRFITRSPDPPAPAARAGSSTRASWRSFAASHPDREREGRAHVHLALDPDVAAVKFDELSAERQSEARAFRLLLRRPDLPELLEYRLLVLRRDPGPGIADGHRDEPVLWYRHNVDPAALRRELDGVPQEVQKHLLDLPLIPRDLTEPLVASLVKGNGAAAGPFPHEPPRR